MSDDILQGIHKQMKCNERLPCATEALRNQQPWPSILADFH